jgi:hypothetical protein
MMWNKDHYHIHYSWLDDFCSVNQTDSTWSILCISRIVSRILHKCFELVPCTSVWKILIWFYPKAHYPWILLRNFSSSFFFLLVSKNAVFDLVTYTEPWLLPSLASSLASWPHRHSKEVVYLAASHAPWVALLPGQAFPSQLSSIEESWNMVIPRNLKSGDWESDLRPRIQIVRLFL